jgi:hypothetical protein
MTRYYFEKNDDYRLYDTETKTFSTVERLPYDKQIFYTFDGYASDEGLLKYIDDLKQWTKELKETTKIDYMKFRTHNGAIPLIVKNICKEFDNFEEPDVTEATWIEKCNNSGLQMLLKEGKRECYGTDFKAFYLAILGKPDLDFDIPMKRGKEYTLKEIDFYKLQCGKYRVKITSNDPNFIFAYSEDHVYTNISLYDAFKYQRQGLKIKLELIQDGKPNAYLYGTKVSDGVHKSRYVFGKLYDKLMKAKIKYPKNKLIKFICSSIWGHICSFNEKTLTDEEILEQDLYVTPDPDNKEADYYLKEDKGNYNVLINIKKPYKYNIARIKPFLLSMGRRITTSVCMLYIDDLVRVHTDGIVFSKPHPDVMTKFKSYPELVAEDKTTGLIDWEKCNNYYNFTRKEKHGKYSLK